VSRPNQAPDLDIAFLTKGRKTMLAGIPVFGLDACVGVVLVDSKAKLASKEINLRSVEGLQHIFRSDGDVAILTIPDLKKWLAFFDHLKNSDLYKKNGLKIFGAAGLNRSTEKRHVENLMDCKVLFDPKLPYLARRRVKSVQELKTNKAQANLDLAFLKKNEEVAFVPLSHVKIAELPGNSMLREFIVDKKVLVPGVIVINALENKRDALLRARRAEAYYQKLYNETHKRKARVVVPIASSGQINLWKKLGYEGAAKAHLEETELNTEQLVRLLYLGKDSLNQGELARFNLSLPGNIETMLVTTNSPTHSERSVFSRADLVFFKRNRFGQRVLTTLEQPVLGIDFGKLKNGERAVKPISHIGGMVIVPENATVKEIKVYIESIQKLFGHHNGDPTAQLLCVTNWLYEKWLANGSIFASDEMLKQEATSEPLGKRVEYGTGLDSGADVYYMRHQPHAMVGGAIDGIYEHSQDSTVFHMLNLGGYFGQGLSKSQSSLAGKPSTALGILPHLQSGELPKIPGLWDREYLLKSALRNPAISHDDPRDTTSSFLRAELVRSMDSVELKEILGEPLAATIASLGQADLLRWGEQWNVAHWLLQHPHADHHGNAPYADRDMTIIARTEAAAIITALSRQANSWRDRHDRVSLVAHPKVKNRYQTVPRPIRLIHSNEQVVRISHNITYRSVLVNHSIPGAGAQSIQTRNSHLINPGDIRPGPLTEAFLGSFEKQADVLLLETTNAPDTRKASAGTTEQEVLNDLTKAMRASTGRLVVVAAPKNHPERLAAIIAAAEATGRKVAVSDKHANIINQLILAKSQAPPTVDGFNHFTPHVGSQVGLWLRHREQPRPYVKALEAVASGGELGVVDEAVLSENSDQWVIVMDPWEHLQYNFGSTVLAKGLSYIWSSYYVYDVDSKRIFGANISWLKQQGQIYPEKQFQYFADFTALGNNIIQRPTHDGMTFHASGHGTFSFMADLAANLIKPSGATIVLMHGQHPTNYARNLREHLAMQEKTAAETSVALTKAIGPNHPSRLRIIHKLDAYDPASPLNSNNPLGLSGFTHKIS